MRVGHNIVEVWRLMSRPRRVCRPSVIMRVVSAVVRLSSRPIVDRLLIAVGHIVVALLKLPPSEGRSRLVIRTLLHGVLHPRVGGGFATVCAMGFAVTHLGALPLDPDGGLRPQDPCFASVVKFLRHNNCVSFRFLLHIVLFSVG